MFRVDPKRSKKLKRLMVIMHFTDRVVPFSPFWNDESGVEPKIDNLNKFDSMIFHGIRFYLQCLITEHRW